MRHLSWAVAVFAAVTLSSAAVVAQGLPLHSGVYLTVMDYLDDRLSLDGDCTSKNYKLELHDSLIGPFIHVTIGTDRQRYEKRDLYGLRACDGRPYRFIDSHEYEIRESQPIALYTLLVRGGRHRIRRHFFSIGPAGAVVPLSRKNLKKAFPDNVFFQNAIDRTFHDDDELLRYDDSAKTYLVNRLWLASTSRER